MTIRDAIDQADQLRPNELDLLTKLRWLSRLDGKICTELLAAFAGEPVEIVPYEDQASKLTTPLVIPFPYDELYPRYLAMRIDLEHGELERYNNDAALFNRLWQTTAAHYCRTHSPKGVGQLKF
ncbi:MAG: hypothetical protein J5789_04070 [Oscillospiraceae bacterium]|nr:hypothetical protein [Oscillospiraceae bacterium]